MSDALIISVSGVRGIVGTSLTAETALRFGRAFGTFLRQSPASQDSAEAALPTAEPAATDGQPLTVAVGRDSRPTGPMVQCALMAGLMEQGLNVVDLGVATTPGVAMMGTHIAAKASVVVTASHNPGQWNGIKFLHGQGRAFGKNDAAAIERAWRAGGWTNANGKLGRYSTDSRTHAHHVAKILSYVDAMSIAQKRYKVVLDSVNGAGCFATPMLLSKLGAELIHINGQATGEFAHTPEPTRENLTQLCGQVRRHRAAVGFAQDPDADRLAIVDENGVYIGEEYTLALAAWARLSRGKGVAVTNLSTSRMIDDIATRFGGTVTRTPVGEANVAEAMVAQGAAIGGEGNGGVIDPRLGLVRDSFAGIALTLELMTRLNRSISELIADLPRYAMIKTKFDCGPAAAAELVEQTRRHFAGQRIDTQDGVRVDTDKAWVHVRPSNTEPIARVIAEGKTEVAAQSLIDEVLRLRKDVGNGE